MRAIFIGCSKEQHNWGGHTGDHESLEIGKEYKVEKREVHSFHTKIFLKGFDGSFNSVCFVDEALQHIKKCPEHPLVAAMKQACRVDYRER